MAFRSHNFSFKLFARSKKEARMIREIITYLKTGTAPKIASANSGINLNTLLGGQGDASEEDNADAAQAQAAINDVSAISNARYFDVPDKFQIKFVRMNPSAEGGSVLSSSNMHFKVEDSVCTNMAVNYTPDGQYTSFKDITSIGGSISVPVVQIDMSFTETKLLSQADLMAGF